MNQFRNMAHVAIAFGVLGTGLTLTTMSAYAALVTHSTAELITFRDCIAGNTPCDDLANPPIAMQYGGFPSATASSSGATVTGYGSAFGSVALSGQIGAPILRAYSSSDAGTRTSTNSVALQRYTYTGDTAVTRTFGGDLTYSQYISGDYPIAARGGIMAQLSVFKLSVDEVDVGDTPESNFRAINFPFGLPGYEELAYDRFDDDLSVSNGLARLSTTWLLNPGDIVWAWALILTPAPNGSWVDSLSTFITGWNDITSLVPAAIAAVPEPGSAAVLSLALLLLGVATRPASSRYAGR